MSYQAPEVFHLQEAVKAVKRNLLPEKKKQPEAEEETEQESEEEQYQEEHK